MDRCCAAALFVIVIASDCVAQTTGSAEYREVRCQVVDEAGWAVANTEVILYGTERDALYAMSEVDGDDRKSAEKYHGWKFTTDDLGYFTARFGKFVQYRHAQLEGVVEPGYGKFYFVVNRQGFAGGVSRELLNLNGDELEDYKLRQAAARLDVGQQDGEEWECNPYLLADGDNPELLTIVVRRGIEVTGQIKDTDNRPVIGVDMELFSDLHAGSHTGHGNEIFSQRATSDHDGRFHFWNVYPNTFYLELPDHSNGPPYWIRTRVRNRWVDNIEDEITPNFDEDRPDKSEKSIDLAIIVTREPIYRYFGRVTDSEGHPVPGAKVEVRCTLHDPERTFEDDHSYYWNTKTNRDGRYSVRVGSRFVNAIWITAKGYDDRDSGVQEEIFAPGEYNFTLIPR